MRSRAGVRLIEELARKPRVHVAAWKLDDVISGDVGDDVRSALLQMRHLAIDNVVVMTSRRVTDVLLDTVSTHISHFARTIRQRRIAGDVRGDRPSHGLTDLGDSCFVPDVWPGGVVVKALEGRGFDSRPFRFQVTTFGKLFTHVCLCHQAV